MAPLNRFEPRKATEPGAQLTSQKPSNAYIDKSIHVLVCVLLGFLATFRNRQLCGAALRPKSEEVQRPPVEADHVEVLPAVAAAAVVATRPHPQSEVAWHSLCAAG